MRASIVFKSDFPINDGGFFYQIVRQIGENQFRPPIFINYNQEKIPFVYSPGAFYVTALISKVFGADVLQLFRYIPLVFSILSIPLVYLFCKKIFNTQISLLATLVFAFYPHSYNWLIMGGGVPRAIGFCLAMLALIFWLKFMESNKKWIGAAGVGCLTLAIICHLEWAFFAIMSGAVLVFRSKKLIKFIFPYVAGVSLAIFLSLPWWIRAVYLYGTGPIISFSRAGLNTGGNLGSLLLPFFVITDEFMLPVVQILAWLGVVLCLRRRSWWLPAWTALPIFLVPRTAPDQMVLPMTILAALTVDHVFGDVLRKYLFPSFEKSMEIKKFYAVWLLFLLVVTHIGLSNMSILHSDYAYSQSVSKEQRESFAWIKRSTDPHARFLLITQTEKWGMDYVSEWFPVLAERKNLILPQGTEWIKDEFNKQVELYFSAKDCQYTGIDCYENLIKAEGQDYNYVYYQKSPTGKRNISYPAGYSVSVNSRYVKVYENKEAVIYKSWL